MGGPGAAVWLSVLPTDEDRRNLWAQLERLGTRSSEHEAWPDLFVETTRPINGRYEGGGRPFGVRWVVGEAYPGEAADHPGRDEQIFRMFGTAPRSRILIDAGCNGTVDHRILGELVLHLARWKSGLIDFCGALFPASVSREWNAVWLFEEARWLEVAEPVQRFFGTFPGTLGAIPYRTHSGRTWASHVCDVAFMEAWLNHPDFYMIK